MNNFGIPESRLFMLKLDYNCTYKIKNFKYKISRLLKNDPHLIKFETSTINTSGYYCLLFLPWPKCFHSFCFSDPVNLPLFLGRKSSESSSESCFSFSFSSSSLAELPAAQKSFYKPFNDHFRNGKMVSEKLFLSECIFALFVR